MLNGILSVFVIFIIFSLGFWLTYKKYWPENSSTVLSAVVVKIGAPALAVIGLYDRFSKELLKATLLYLMIIIAYTLLLYVTGKILARIMKLQVGKKTVFEVTFTFSNTIFIGLPINEIVFGHQGLPYLFTFYLVTLAGFWSLGAWELARGSELGKGSFSLKKIFNPGLIGVLVGAFLVQMEWNLPLVFDSVLRYLSTLCVPLSLLVIGARLVGFTKGIPKLTIDEIMILLGKFVISPIFMFIFLKIFNVEGLPFQVFMLTSTMPCHMQTSIVAEYYDVEPEYASKLVSISTLVCLVTIPIYVSILT